jgi:hypothetical protein
MRLADAHPNTIGVLDLPGRHSAAGSAQSQLHSHAQNAGQVTIKSVATRNCLKTEVHSTGPKCEGMDFGIGRNALECNGTPTVGV